MNVENGQFLVSLACIWEVSARKIGNVHPLAEFEDASSLDFVMSGCALGLGIDWPSPYHQHISVGRRIRHAVEQSVYSTKSNTNLGIAVLLGPLVAIGADRDGPLTNPPYTVYELQRDLPAVLQKLTVEDAVDVYEAIRIANPGGLGTVTKQDVKDEPTVTLLEAMRLAADRDLIARQYVTNYSDVFDFGVPLLLEGVKKFGSVEAGILHTQLEWLALYPDSLIARKNGTQVAEDVRQWANGVIKAGGIATEEGRRACRELDRHLRSDGNKLNPGTTADLITACLFVALRENKVSPASPFRWNCPDWLAP
jgi:triphosphoribosyl-dephospho-CoA synthase